MQTCSWSRYGTFVLCEYGLEILGVFWCDIFLDPVRNRSLSESEKSLFEVFIASVIKETERASSRGSVIDDLGYEAFILSEIELVADTDFSGRIYDDIPESLLAVELSS